MPVFNESMSVGSRVTALWTMAWTIVTASALPTGLYVLVMAAAGTIADITETADGASGIMAVNIVGLVAGFVLCRTLVEKAGLLRPGVSKGFGSYFGLALLSNIATVVGFVLLIVPGVLLLVRWLPAFGFLLGDGENVDQSLSSSWRRTQGHFWALFLGALVLLPVLFISTAAYAMVEEVQDAPTTVAFVIANLALYVSTAAWTAYGIAAYALLKDDRDELSGVFG